MATTTLTAQIHDEGDGPLWAEVVELPGCFATGDDRDELLEALAEAIALHTGQPVRSACWAEATENVEQVGLLVDA